MDENKLNEFLGMAIGDVGAAMSASLILLGDRLGLYKALAAAPVTSTQLAEKTGTVERYVREWLQRQPHQLVAARLLDGAVERLQAGAKVADVGCGHGVSTILMARTYPDSTFIGYDYHPGSVHVAAERAEAAGLTNALFEVADATGYTDKEFDLIAFFDCLHDMGDPVGVMRHGCAALKDDGIAMIVESFAGDRVQDNMNPVGRMM